MLWKLFRISTKVPFLTFLIVCIKKYFFHKPSSRSAGQNITITQILIYTVSKSNYGNLIIIIMLQMKDGLKFYIVFFFHKFFRFPCFSWQNNWCRLPIRNQICQMNWHFGRCFWQRILTTSFCWLFFYDHFFGLLVATVCNNHYRKCRVICPVPTMSGRVKC